MKVSFIVIAYNEEKTIKSLFNDLINQDYPHELIEVILVDGMSTDNTKGIMKNFGFDKYGFERVVIKENPKKTLPCGWNIAILESKNELIIRVDAHSSIPKDFIRKNVECIKSGEKICGGYRPNIIDEETSWKKTLLLAETSMFGSSIAPYRRNSEKRYVNSVFHGAYCREVFEKVGLYNELLARTEDNDIHYRMRKAGYNICFDPNIISYQHTRSSLKGMLRQKYLNGYWIGITMGVSPNCFSIYHFIPLIFVLSIVGTSIISILQYKVLAQLLWGSYIIINCIMSIVSILSNKFTIYNLMLPILFLFLHLSYGIGTLVGLYNMPVYRLKNRKKVEDEKNVESY